MWLKPLAVLQWETNASVCCFQYVYYGTYDACYYIVARTTGEPSTEADSDEHLLPSGLVLARSTSESSAASSNSLRLLTSLEPSTHPLSISGESGVFFFRL